MLKSLAIFLVAILMVALFSACKSSESVQLLSDNSSEMQTSDTVDSVISEQEDNKVTSNNTSGDKNTANSLGTAGNNANSDKNSNTTSNQTPNSSQSSTNEGTENTTEEKSPIEGLSLAEQYYWYENSTGQEQSDLMQTFPSVPDFVDWHNKVEAAYKAEHPEVELDKDSIVSNSKQ